MRKLIWEHPDVGMSFKSLNPYYSIVFEDIIFRYIILEIPKDRFMHLMRFETMSM